MGGGHLEEKEDEHWLMVWHWLARICQGESQMQRAVTFLRVVAPCIDQHLSLQNEIEA